MYIQALDNITLTFSSDFSIALKIADASIKNQVATSISHIHIYNKQVIKMIHHAINVTTTEAKLFAIRCGINQTTNLQGIRKIVVITDSARKIFNYSLYSFQVHMTSISNKLRRFFDTNNSNTIEFCKYSS